MLDYPYKLYGVLSFRLTHRQDDHFYILHRNLAQSWIALRRAHT